MISISRTGLPEHRVALLVGKQNPISCRCSSRRLAAEISNKWNDLKSVADKLNSNRIDACV